MNITEHEFNCNLMQLTEKIKKQPELYLGEKSLTKFYHYVNGFSDAHHYMDKEQKYFVIYPGFQEWIQNKYKINLTKSWCNILLFYCSNEEEAFELFFKELSLYIQQS